MNAMPRLLTAAIVAALALTACRKEAPADAGTSAADAAPAATPPAEPPAPPTAEPTAEQRDAIEKQKAIDRALAEQEFLDDPNGQWATSAQASSTYATVLGSRGTDNTAEAATGKPDAQDAAYPELGWRAEKDGAGIEWLELGYATPVHATAVRVRQIYGPGAIIKVELIDESGARRTVWQGRDDTAYEPNQVAWFVRTFDRTETKVRGVRLTLATNAVSPHESIDAVQLVGG